MKTPFLYVLSMAILACLFYACSPAQEEPDYDMQLQSLTEDQYQLLWADTITPPNDPLALKMDSAVTIVGKLDLGSDINLVKGTKNVSGERYCMIWTKNWEQYFLVTRHSNNSDKFTLWRFDAALLQPENVLNNDTICVGDSIAITGYPYALSYFLHIKVFDTYLVQKYSSTTHPADHE